MSHSPRLLRIIVLCILFFVPLMVCGARKTMMRNGTWISCTTPFMAQADIDGALMTVCLPRLEFSESPDPQELQKRMKDAIKKQGAVFHLFHDGLGSPLKRGGMVFASDVFLKDLKMTYSETLRSWGYKFSAAKKPAFEDPSYLMAVQSGAASAGSSKDPKTTKVKPLTGPGWDPNSGKVMLPSDLVPAGYLPPETRKLKKELDRKIREIKARPYKPEIPRVDMVRWATGKFGTLQADGRVIQAMVEGQMVECLLTPPTEKTWLTPELVKEIASQPCEFILQRDTQGREARKNGAYVLADLYFTDLAQTWEEWLTAHSLTYAPLAADPGFATGPLELAIKGVDAEWVGLQAPVIGKAKVSTAAGGVPELFRLPALDQPVPQFKKISEGLAPKTAGKPCHLALIVCADGNPYLELGQKRVARVLFPHLKTTLKILMQEAVDALPTTEK
jgi:hypothetical protein